MHMETSTGMVSNTLVQDVSTVRKGVLCVRELQRFLIQSSGVQLLLLLANHEINISPLVFTNETWEARVRVRECAGAGAGVRGA